MLPSEVLSAALCALVAAVLRAHSASRRDRADASSLLLVPVPAARAAALAGARRAARPRRSWPRCRSACSPRWSRRSSLRDRMTARHSRRRRPLRPRDGRGARLDDGRTRSSCTPPALLHDIGKFAFPDAILLADSRLDRRASGRSSSATPRTARGSSGGSTATARWPRSSAPTTSASTAAATRAGWPATRSRSARG